VSLRPCSVDEAMQYHLRNVVQGNVNVEAGRPSARADQRKKELFTEVYNLLNTGGYFINGDLFKSKYDVVNKKYYDDVWARRT